MTNINLKTKISDDLFQNTDVTEKDIKNYIEKELLLSTIEIDNYNDIMINGESIILYPWFTVNNDLILQFSYL